MTAGWSEEHSMRCRSELHADRAAPSTFVWTRDTISNALRSRCGRDESLRIFVDAANPHSSAAFRENQGDGSLRERTVGTIVSGHCSCDGSGKERFISHSCTSLLDLLHFNRPSGFRIGSYCISTDRPVLGSALSGDRRFRPNGRALNLNSRFRPLGRTVRRSSA